MAKTIKFLERVVYETEGPNKGPVFEEGSRHTLDDDKADRWIRRGVAVEARERSERPTGGGKSANVGGDKALADSTIAELTRIAKNERIELGDARKHAEIVKAIEEARRKAAGDNQ